jgi:hypothetical protein
MSHLQTRQEEAARAIVAEFAKAETQGQVYLVSVQTFGQTAGEPSRKTPFRPASVYSQPGAWDTVKFKCDEGGTALLDAVGHAYTQLNARDPEASLVQVITDGGENSSRSWSPGTLGDALRKVMAKGNFTLAVTGPVRAGDLLCRCGLPDDNFRPWDGATEASFRQTTAATVQATQSYTAARTKGARSVTNFYTVDPSKLNTAGVRGYMQQVVPTENITVPKRMAGRAIADAFAKFQKGHHYYQLVKPEYIEDGKELVVHIKDKNEYRLGSRSARQLLGLPEDGKIRVKPAEVTAPFDIYVQSGSNNRKLVEGQKLLTIG